MKPIKETCKEKQQRTQSGVTEERHIENRRQCNVSEEDEEKCQLCPEKYI